MFKVDVHFCFRCLGDDKFEERSKIKVNLGRKAKTDVENHSPPLPPTNISFIFYSESFEFPSLWYNLAVTHARLVSNFSINFF